MINEKYVKKFCKEDISKIENYEKAVADTTQMWHCHHRTAIWWNCSKKDLIDNECYYGRKACELIFLTPEEHKSLHSTYKSEEHRRKVSAALKGRTSPMKGRHRSDEFRQKISEATKGENNPFYGKHHTDEAIKKMSASLKGRTSPRKGKVLSDETKRKMSAAHKGRKRGPLSEETRKKMSEAAKRRYMKKVL